VSDSGRERYCNVGSFWLVSCSSPITPRSAQCLRNSTSDVSSKQRPSKFNSHVHDMLPFPLLMKVDLWRVIHQERPSMGSSIEQVIRGLAICRTSSLFSLYMCAMILVLESNYDIPSENPQCLPFNPHLTFFPLGSLDVLLMNGRSTRYTST